MAWLDDMAGEQHNDLTCHGATPQRTGCHGMTLRGVFPASVSAAV